MTTQTDHTANVQAIFSELRFPSGLKIGNRLIRSNMSGMFDDYNGHGGNARLNWEERFARGGVGCIISSYAPVTARGRILTRYAMIDNDDKIPFWREVGRRVNRHDDCKFILQLSHSGRQQDMGGVENLHRRVVSSTSKKDFFHGILCRAMDTDEIAPMVQIFAEAAARAKEAGLHGVELHGANGYLITQFLSSAINDRKDQYGGSIENRTRFVLEIVRAIRHRVGDFHLQMKINAVDHNNWLYPWMRRGNTLEDAIEMCRILEDDGKGVDAFHISSGSTFPHPRNPPGDFPIRAARRWYDVMISQGVRAMFNYRIFRSDLLGAAFRKLWLWQRGSMIEGINAEYARAIKKHVNVPVICTGGWQTASAIAEAIRSGACDAVSIARPLIRNPNLPRILKEQNAPDPGKECTYCNLCLLNDLENPLGCYDVSRYDGANFDEQWDNMISEVMSVFDPPTIRHENESAD